jgi:hypothetical protein
LANPIQTKKEISFFNLCKSMGSWFSTTPRFLYVVVGRVRSKLLMQRAANDRELKDELRNLDKSEVWFTSLDLETAERYGHAAVANALLRKTSQIPDVDRQVVNISLIQLALDHDIEHGLLNETVIWAWNPKEHN